QIKLGHPQVRPAALAIARKFGTKSAALADVLWPQVFAKSKAEDALDPLATLAHIEIEPRKENWAKLLASTDATVRTDAVRWWRAFKGKPDMVELLVRQAPELVKRDAGLADDLGAVFRHLEAPPNWHKEL